MHYLLDELHAYEHDYSGALCPVSHKANPSLAGDRALYAPASRKELASFQTLIMADVKDIHGALNNLDIKVDRIEDVLRGLTEAITAVHPSPIPTHPILSGMWPFFFCVTATDCQALTTEHITHPQHPTTRLPAPPVESNHIGPCHFSFSCAPTQAFC